VQPVATRSRNKTYYRALHVPIWIWVFFTLPGGLTADLYAHGFHRRQAIWLAIVAAVCIWRGLLGRLPGAEPRPYITHYGLKWPNLTYRVVCYTAAWIAIVVPWTLNLFGVVYAALGGRWIVTWLYGTPYDLLAVAVVLVAALNRLPRARRSIRYEGEERAWFYVGVWTAVIAQAAGWAAWRLLAAPSPWLRLAVFVAVSGAVLAAGIAERLPRTRRVYLRRDGRGLREAAAE
jgi:hypothetical protein